MTRYIISIGLTLLTLIGLVYSWSYPLKYISKPECKYSYSHFDKMPSSCKISIPRIYNWNYKKYKTKDIYKSVYSVLWLSTYKDWWDYGKGSHLWVDIATIKWTPVYAIEDWYVEFAWWKLGRGNVIVIKHKFKWRYVRSIYAHLNKIYVKKWQIVKEWQKIWEVGNTWFSFGNHLHFQIDISQTSFHPYYYNGCGKETTIVNNWLCQNLVILNTTDPIAFIEKKGSYLDFKKIEKVANLLKDKQVSKNSKVNTNTNYHAAPVKKSDSSEKVVLSSTEQVKEPVVKKVDSNETFVTKYKIWFNKDTLVIRKGSAAYVDIEVIRKFKNLPYDGTLTRSIDIKYDKSVVSISPASIKYVSKWKRTIKIYWKKSWVIVLFLKVGDIVVDRLKITIIDNNISKWLVAKAVPTISKVYVWNWWLVAIKFYDDKWNRILYPTNNLIVQAQWWIICGISIKSKLDIKLSYKKDCITEKKDVYNLTKNDIYNWIWFVKIYPSSTKWTVKIIVKDEKWNIIGESFPKLIYLPKDIKKISWGAQKLIIDWLTKWYIDNYKNWYFAPNFDLDWITLKRWIKNIYWKDINISSSKVTIAKFVDIMNKLKKKVYIIPSWRTITRQEAAYWIVYLKNK